MKGIFENVKTLTLITLLKSGTDLNEVARKELINRGINTKKILKLINRNKT